MEGERWYRAIADDSLRVYEWPAQQKNHTHIDMKPGSRGAGK